MTPLRVLLVEDSPDDAELLLRELKHGGYEVAWQRVDTPEAMADALTHKWDIVCSDFTMPRFSAIAAFQLLRDRNLDVPFIIVSGTVGEETAVDAMRLGVHDYMLKGRWSRLVPAIQRELREAEHRAERKKLQEQLFLADRLASVGTLAAGVAHEINNPLASCIANLEIVNQKLTSGRLVDWETPLNDARESAERIRLIVRDLKVFARGDEEKHGAVDVQSVLDSSVRMAFNEIRHRARLVKDYSEIPAAMGNEGRLGQVFLNLLINAAQAIPEGNTERNEIRVVTRLDAHRRIIVEVHDTGGGIPPSVMSRIFDAFYTTKPVGVGTGLGLAICHRIIVGMGGSIGVESELGKGSMFRVTMPAAEGAVVPARHAAPKAESPKVARGRVLVVDDEAVMGRTVARVLSLDHDVTVVTSGREALNKFEAGERFDVILSDLMMPDIGGAELHAAVIARDPAQADRMIFMTGGAFTSQARDFLNAVTNPRIEKPFDLRTLQDVVEVMMGRRDTSSSSVQ